MDPLSGNPPPVDFTDPEPSAPPTNACAAPPDTVEAYRAQRDAPACSPQPRAPEQKLFEGIREHARNEVELCRRPADIIAVRIADVMTGDALDLNHHWIRTAHREAGMGADGGGVAGHHLDIPFVTPETVNDHSGEGGRAGSGRQPVPGVDAACVDRELEVGKKLGTWTPWNQCQTFAKQVLDRCAEKAKKE
jgi:hypothetical protein